MVAYNIYEFPFHVWKPRSQTLPFSRALHNNYDEKLSRLGQN